jgi:hypothetical protein
MYGRKEGRKPVHEARLAVEEEEEEAGSWGQDGRHVALLFMLLFSSSRNDGSRCSCQRESDFDLY